VTFWEPYEVVVVTVPLAALGSHADTVAGRTAIAVGTDRGPRDVVGTLLDALAAKIDDCTPGTQDEGRPLRRAQLLHDQEHRRADGIVDEHRLCRVRPGQQWFGQPRSDRRGRNGGAPRRRARVGCHASAVLQRRATPRPTTWFGCRQVDADPSAATRNPMLPALLSGVLALRAAQR
jgi:hypothetical protein